jgi:SAM-dependent methyltransferase
VAGASTGSVAGASTGSVAGASPCAGSGAPAAANAIRRGHPSYVWRAGQERRLRMVREHVPLEGRTILDIGCGLGMYTQAFRRYTPHVYGIEIELDRAVQALDRAAGVFQAVGEALPFPTGAFDVVYNHEVLEHVDDDRRTVREMVRVTRPGAHIVTFVPNRLWPWETHGVHWRGRYHEGNIPLVNYLPNALRDRLAGHVRAYTRRSLLALFRDLPVKVLVHRTIYPGYDNIVYRFPRLGPWVRGLSYRLERWPVARHLGLSHLLVLQKTSPHNR